MTRRAAAPGWAKNQMFASTVSLALVGLAPLGVGLVALGLTEPMTLASYAGIAGIVGAMGLLWWEVRG
ncbi:hypothetical protein [Tropicibacter oceani]|uniref:Uncharacterized protein n=1 Tax=Tropicibacter oceani TaxID=3058420 RepID=A0ABY8QMP0_9RHOB|nr:hypothetical protein [Tropicibacter oceani]WGW05052.1 hypothetical protein QF118_05745 [Tropicibacter oceani]